jgi:tetratricopeptide (TPR) repeat protein
VDGVATVHLGVLTAPDAVTLLGRLAGGERIAADPGAADEVADRCGHLPLALRIAGARLTARPGWPVRALADRLADAQRRLDELQAGDLGVRASFQVSLDALGSSADPADRAAAVAFPLVAVPDGADLGTAVAARLLDRPEPAAEAVLERLVDAQLLDSPAPGRYRLHDLIRLFARECAAEGRTASLVRVLAWYREVACRSLELLRPGHRHPVLATGRSDVDVPFDTAPDAVEWLEAERANLVAVIAQAAADEAVPAALPVAIAQALCGFFQVRGHWHDWIEVSRTALAAAGDPAGRGYAHRDLGVAHELRGDYDQARADLSASLDLFARAGDAHGRAAALTSLGIIHHRQGRYGCAVACFQESIAIRRDLGDTRGQAINLSNVGVTHQRTGRYADADACYREALAIFQHLDDQPVPGASSPTWAWCAKAANCSTTRPGTTSAASRSSAYWATVPARRPACTTSAGPGVGWAGSTRRWPASTRAWRSANSSASGSTAPSACVSWATPGGPPVTGPGPAALEQAHEVFAALGVPEAAEVAAQISDS